VAGSAISVIWMWRVPEFNWALGNWALSLIWAMWVSLAVLDVGLGDQRN
jgi:hypothetical protein